MSNNTVLNPGSLGDTIATEDIAGVKYEQVKLIDSTAGSTSPTGVTANPLKVTVSTALPAGDNNIGNVDLASALPAGSNLVGKVELTDGAGTVNTKALGTQLVSGDVGLVTNTIIHGITTGGGGGYVDVKVNPSGALTTAATIANGDDVALGATTDAAVTTNTTGTISAKLRGLVAILSNVWNSTTSRLKVELASMTMDTGGRVRTSNLFTLFDGKLSGNVEDAFKWDIKGTGSNSVANNSVTLTVTSGQYVVRQAKIFTPYYSGKPQLVEVTGSNFQYATGLIKRFGYFSSSAVAPYTANFDGWYIESDGVNSTYRLVCCRNGTETHNIPWTSWDNYSLISGYDWSKFTVSEVDFLWLGGAGLRMFFVINGAFTLIHTIDDHAGTQADLIMQSPNQPVRYEIRSTTGAGSYTTICSQVATEGTAVEEGEELAFYTASLACNTVGTIYALAGVRKSATYRTSYIDVHSVGASIVSATVDSGVLLLILNPTLSAPLTWAANSRIEVGTATTQTITAGTGRILMAIPMNTSGSAGASPHSALRALPLDIDNTAGQLILAYQPTSSNQNVVGQMTVVEY